MRENVAVKRAPGPEVKSSAEDVVKTFLRSVDSAKRSEQPYRHWVLRGCFPADSVEDIEPWVPLLRRVRLVCSWFPARRQALARACAFAARVHFR